MPGVVRETVQFSHWLLSVVILLSCKWEEAGHSSLYKCVCCFSLWSKTGRSCLFLPVEELFLDIGAVNISSSFLHDRNMAANILCVLFPLWSTLEGHRRGKNRCYIHVLLTVDGWVSTKHKTSLNKHKCSVEGCVQSSWLSTYLVYVTYSLILFKTKWSPQVKYLLSQQSSASKNSQVTDFDQWKLTLKVSSLLIFCP